MTRYQSGFINRQTGLLLMLFGLVLAFALPKFGELSDRKKVSEAYRLANDSQIRVSEFYNLSARFPQTEVELRSITGDPSAKPHFIDAVEIESADEAHDIVVRVYLNSEEVESEDGRQPVLYMMGKRNVGMGRSLQWRCGAEGLDAGVLPPTCAG